MARHLGALNPSDPSHPGQDISAGIVTELATAILRLDDRLKALDAQIEATFAKHPKAAVIRSMPGSSPILGSVVGRGPTTYVPSPVPGTSQLQPDSCPSPTTPAGAPATCTGRCATADHCATCSTSPRKPA